MAIPAIVSCDETFISHETLRIPTKHILQEAHGADWISLLLLAPEFLAAHVARSPLLYGPGTGRERQCRRVLRAEKPQNSLGGSEEMQPDKKEILHGKWVISEAVPSCNWGKCCYSPATSSRLAKKTTAGIEDIHRGKKRKACVCYRGGSQASWGNQIGDLNMQHGYFIMWQVQIVDACIRTAWGHVQGQSSARCH